MDRELGNKLVRKIVHQLVNTKLSRAKIIENITKETYLTKGEARRVYSNAQDVLIDIIRQAQVEKNVKKKKSK